MYIYINIYTYINTYIYIYINIYISIIYIYIYTFYVYTYIKQKYYDWNIFYNITEDTVPSSTWCLSWLYVFKLHLILVQVILVRIIQCFNCLYLSCHRAETILCTPFLVVVELTNEKGKKKSPNEEWAVLHEAYW